MSTAICADLMSGTKMQFAKIVQRGPQDKWFVTHSWLDVPLGPYDTLEQAEQAAADWQRRKDEEQGAMIYG